VKTSAGVGRAPFVVTVAPRTCQCALPARELFKSGNRDRAIANATGYWCVYLAFFGEQLIWLDWLVTDIRDGRIIWRNGRHTQEGKGNGKQGIAA
jgi:hypothetical protein